MSEAPYMPFWWDAYLGDTTHLTTEEHGAYMLLLGAMWRRNGSVPDDDADNARITGLSKAKWKKVKLRLSTLLIFENDEISQKKLKKTYEKSKEKITKNRENGRKGGRPKSKENNDLDLANGFNSDNPIETIPSPSPSPNNSSLLSASVNEETVNLMLDALGVTDETKSHGLLVWTEIFRWFENGCDLEKDILPVLRAKAAQGHKANNWAYFTKPIFQAKANRTAPPPTVEAKPTFQPFEDAVDRRRRKLKEKQQQEANNVH